MTPKLGLTLLANGQQNYLNANQTSALLDQLVQGAVIDKDLATPPGSPDDGALYIVAASATGAWSGMSGNLAYWLDDLGLWAFIVPNAGFLFHVDDEGVYYTYNGSSWSALAGGGGGAAWGSITGTLSSQTDLQAALDAKGALGIPQNSKSAAYTPVLSDNGKHIFHPSADTTARSFTIPANATTAFPIGAAITFVNQSGAGIITIAITSDTMRLAGAGTTGARTLAANGIATALKVTATEWIISGVGLT